MRTRGEWLLFTDADTCHEPQTLRVMMGHALQHQDDLLSMGMNVMTLSGPATPLLMPVTEILLAHRLTPATLQDPSSPRAFAFGQYILLRRKAYLQTRGYDAPEMRACAVEDLALAEQMKQSGRRVEMVDGRGLLHNRQWTTWKSTREGWGKSCYSEIIRSRIPLGGLPAALGLIAYGLLPAGTMLYLGGRGKVKRISFWLASLTVLAQIDAKRRFDRKYGLRLPWALTAPLAWAVCGLMALDTTRQIVTGRRTTWKGRQIPRQERARASRVRLSLVALPAAALYERDVPSGYSDTAKDEA
jgi:chlorobactene glucosyltransferase